MIFKIEAQKLKRNKTVPILTPIGKPSVAYAVGDTFKGWLSYWRMRRTAIELRKRMKWQHDCSFAEYVFEHGKWEIVSVGYGDL